jgi:putative sterol carrier protein
MLGPGGDSSPSRTTDDSERVATIRSMAEFLSPEWVAALEEAAAASQELQAAAAGVTLVVQQVVRRDGSKELRYFVEFDDGRVHVELGEAPHADLTLITDTGTARALASGTLNAQAALGAGRLELAGRLDALARHEDVIGALGDVFRTVRESTT